MSYKAFVSMNMTSKHQVNSSIIKQLFHGLSHAFAFTLMRLVSVIPRRMQERNYPRGPQPISACQVRLEPPVLVGTSLEVGVGTQHDDVGASNLKGVVKVGVRATFLVGHGPASIVGLEAFGEDDWERLDLVVAFCDHPWPSTSTWLNQTPKGVPQRLVAVSIG